MLTVFVALACGAAANASNPTPHIVLVAAGGAHSCALRTDGSVLCWGNPGKPGTKHRRPTAWAPDIATHYWWSAPRAVISLPAVTSLALGDLHSCGLTAKGTVHCWSDPADGAKRVVGLPAGAVEIAAGFKHTCARDGAGKVWCWGDNSYGQLGRGVAGAADPTPKKVAKLAAAVQLTAGANSTCARDAKGNAYCWGRNRYGQLGKIRRGKQIGEPFVLKPRRWPLKKVDEVAVGGKMSCVRKAGLVSCMGEFWVGNPHGDMHRLKTSPEGIWGIADAVALSLSGGSIGCAIRAGGAVRCFRLGNAMGRTSDLIFAPRRKERRRRGKPLIGQVRQLAMGRLHGCALNAAGAVMCWGHNHAGQLGGGGLHDGSRPVVLAGVGDARQVSVGRRFTCVRRATGAVECLGSNSSRTLGDGTRADRVVPKPVSNLPDAKLISAGDNFVCALRKSGGIRCWGDNQLGTLLDGTRKGTGTPVDAAGIGKARAVQAGDGATCVIDKKAVVRCWGRGPGSGYKGEPLKIPGGAVAMSVGGWGFACALNAKKELYCWGHKKRGKSPRVSVPERMEGVSATSVSVGGCGACLVRPDGRLMCWTDGDYRCHYRQGGRGGPKWAAAPTLVAGLKEVAEVSVGDRMVCARLRSGEVTCWGSNHVGQLGDGTFVKRAVPGAKVLGLTNAVSVSVQDDHACAVRKTGTVVCWGDNSRGQLGNGKRGGGPRRYNFTPRRVPGL